MGKYKLEKLTMYFAQIFKYEKVGEVVWEGPVVDEEAAVEKMQLLEKQMNIPLDLEYWLATREELAEWHRNMRAHIEEFAGKWA